MMKRACLVSVLLLSMPVVAWALTLAPMSLDQMTAASEVVVRGRCLDRTATRTEDGGIESVARFDVVEVAKGEAPKVIEVRQFGGELDGTAVVVPGAPLSEIGDEALLFLERAPGGHLRVVGMALGYLPVVTASPGASVVRVAPYMGAGFESGGLRPVTDVMTRVRRLAERPR
ncbi:MAG: hypothetical protein P8R42_12210 [Candidatus Binatia bacterium]|nr:hypothetical protein [Candidatus Binatia bacterium]